MRTIETTAVVGPDHTITVKLPDDIPPGEVRVFVTVPSATGLPFGLQPIDIGPWPEGFTASREQLYGEDPGQRPDNTVDGPLFQPYPIGLTDPTFTFRREDLYGDGDR
ncbi:MAG: hypothetical protein K2X87_04280 [Gemmataceae bacterium]|nr:hypothetical protein [Gemmataceae bacterium]